MAACEPPFWKDPLGFLTNFNFSYTPACEDQIWNFIARLLIVAVLVGGLGSTVCGLMSFAVCILLAMIFGTVIIMTTQPPKQKAQAQAQTKEAFVDLPDTPEIKKVYTGSYQRIVNRITGVDSQTSYTDSAPYSGPALPEYTPPTARNLFMNVLLDEYKYNPDRPAAAPVDDAVVKQTFDDYFKIQWFSDPTDIFGKSQNQRQFITQPSTSVPNDRKSFQNWLYKIPGKTCKEGGFCNNQGSAGAQYVWMGEN
jgi:hypothetical protein